MIYSPAVYMITGWWDQSGSNGQLNLHFIQRISAPPARLWLSWELWSRRDEAACVPLWSRTHLTGSLTVFIVPRENGKSMELTCPIQCTYHLTEVTGRKDLAQQSKQKTLKGPPGHFFCENYGASISHLKWGLRLSGKVWYYSKVHTSRSKIKIWQCVRPDQLYLLSGSSAWWLLPPPPRAAAQLAALLIRRRLKTLHVPWKSPAQSSDIDRATPRWVFLFLACVWELG